MKYDERADETREKKYSSVSIVHFIGTNWMQKPGVCFQFEKVVGFFLQTLENTKQDEEWKKNTLTNRASNGKS